MFKINVVLLNYLSMNTENVCFHKTIKQHNCFFPSYIHWVIGVGLDLQVLKKKKKY